MAGVLDGQPSDMRLRGSKHDDAEAHVYVRNEKRETMGQRNVMT